MGDFSGPLPTARLWYAPARPRNAVRGAWVGVVVHLAVLAVLMAVAEPEAFWPVGAATGAAFAVAFVWLCACWRVDPGETRWATTADPPRVTTIRWAAALRAAWPPVLAWLVGAAAVMGLLGGFAGIVHLGLLALLLVPFAWVFAWLLWYLVVVSSQQVAHGVAELRAPPPAAPAAPVAHDPERATYDMAVRHASTPQPSRGVPLVCAGLIGLLVLPTALTLGASGAATSRWDAIPALLGTVGVEPTSSGLLWAARACIVLVVAIGVFLSWWLARERRRIEHRQRGFGEL